MAYSQFPTIDEHVLDLIRRVLTYTKGVQKDAAVILGVRPRVMNYYIRRVYHLEAFVLQLREAEARRRKTADVKLEQSTQELDSPPHVDLLETIHGS